MQSLQSSLAKFCISFLTRWDLQSAKVGHRTGGGRQREALGGTVLGSLMQSLWRSAKGSDSETLEARGDSAHLCLDILLCWSFRFSCF